MTTFTLAQDEIYSRLVMVGNIINMHPTGENTVGTQDAKVTWHASNDELAYRWVNERESAQLGSFIWPTMYISGNDVGNGFHGLRLFDDAGHWLGTPDAPLVKAEPVVTPAVAPAALAVPAATPVAPPAGRPAAAPVAPVVDPASPANATVEVHVPAPVTVAAADPVAVAKPVIFPPYVRYVAPKRGLWARVSQWFRSL